VDVDWEWGRLICLLPAQYHIIIFLLKHEIEWFGSPGLPLSFLFASSIIVLPAQVDDECARKLEESLAMARLWKHPWGEPEQA
jgi:hypothetical protein